MTRRDGLPANRWHPLTERTDAAIAPVICAVHTQAVTGGYNGYIDPFTDRWVFTAAYLWNQTSCCDNGCRHCPFASGTRYDSNGTIDA